MKIDHRRRLAGPDGHASFRAAAAARSLGNLEVSRRLWRHRVRQRLHVQAGCRQADRQLQEATRPTWISPGPWPRDTIHVDGQGAIQRAGADRDLQAKLTDPKTLSGSVDVQPMDVQGIFNRDEGHGGRDARRHQPQSLNHRR